MGKNKIELRPTPIKIKKRTKKEKEEFIKKCKTLFNKQELREIIREEISNYLLSLLNDLEKEIIKK